MEIRGHEILGAKIIDSESLKDIGTVKDFVWDPDKNKVIAFITEFGDELKEAKLVPYSEIREINKQAIFTFSGGAAKNSSEVIKTTTASKNPIEKFQDSLIGTPDGRDFGRLRDLVFESGTGEVIKLETSGNQKNEIRPSKIDAATKGLVIVEEEEEKRGEKQNEDEQSKDNKKPKEQIKKASENLVTKISYKINQLAQKLE